VPTSPEYCLNCGAEVPPNAAACPECGSDESTGWSDRARASRLGVPDEEFDYDEFIREEFDETSENPTRSRSAQWVWWVAALILLLLVIAIFLR
jgi:predicted nucleic acid-binding Zn ribbon protein